MKGESTKKKYSVIKIPTNLYDWQAPNQINMHCTFGIQPFKHMPVLEEEPLLFEGLTFLAQWTLVA